MRWDAIGATGEVLGAIAVLATLLYLARQIKQLTKQNHIEAFQHMQDQLNTYLRQISSSEETASLVVKGRQSYSSLNEVERLRFSYIQFQLLNFIESHYTQSRQTALDDDYRQWVDNNLQEILKGEFAYPGCIEFWQSAEPFFDDEVRELINRSLGQA
jgi:hypothetical protein